MITFLKLVIFAAILIPTFLAAIKIDFSLETVKVFKGRLATGVVAFIMAVVLLSGVGFVPSGYRGIVLRFGAVTGRTLEPGIYLLTPVAESVEFMDVQIHADSTKATAASHDLQNVTTEVTVNYAVLPDRAGQVYTDLRQDYVVRIVTPAIQEAVKSTTAQFTAENLIVKRAEVREGIERYLGERLGRHGIRVDTVSITEFAFSDTFNHAIEAKVTAVQQALQAENDLRKVKTVAEQRIATATAEAEAIRIQAESISKSGGPEYVELKRIEKWDGQLPTMVLGGNSGMMMNLPVPKEK
jgi:regulator of protease activity HflC (stomatin/prohibitin superfamily)